MGLIYKVWILCMSISSKLSSIENKIDGLEQSHKLTNDILGIIAQILQNIQAELQPPPAVSLAIKLGGVQLGDNNMLQVSDTGSVLATLEADDALGNPGAKLDTVPVWSLNDATFGAVNASADGMTAVVVLSGKLGIFKLHVDSTAAGAPLAADSEDIEVVVGAAALLKVAVAAQ